MTLIEAHNKFLRVKMIEGLAKSTISEYEKNFRYLMDYLGRDMDISEFDLDKVRDYIYFMIYERGLSNYTVNIRVRNIKAFLRFCYLEGIIESNINARVKLMKTDIDHIQPLTPQEYKELLELINNNRINFTRMRDNLIVYLLLDTMVRVSELVSIKVSDISIEEGTITLRPKNTKTRKYRIVPFSETSANLLVDFLKNRKFKESEYLLTNHIGEQMTADSIQYKFHHWAKILKFKGKRLSPHTVRHTGALYYILNGGDPFSLQRILGHTSMEMVRRYVQMSDDKVKVHHNKFSPINQIDNEK